MTARDRNHKDPGFSHRKAPIKMGYSVRNILNAFNDKALRQVERPLAEVDLEQSIATVD